MPEQHNITPNSKSWSHFLLKLFIPVVAIILAIGVYFGVNFISGQIDATELQADKLATEFKQLQFKYDQLQNSLQDLQNVVQRANIAKAKNWQVIVIEHLIRMADLTLNTSGDTKLALSFLLMAQQYAKNTELSTINHALNKDIANLQTVPLVEISSLVLKIEALGQKINSLPIIIQQFVVNSPPKIDATSDVTLNLWQRFFASTAKALKDVVVIRRRVVEPLLSPEQETIVRLNVQTKLLQAELAVMHRQNKLYHACLESVADLITRYFITGQIVNADILPTLKTLQEIDLQPKLPGLTESLATVHDFISANKIQEAVPQEPSASTSTKGSRPI